MRTIIRLAKADINDFLGGIARGLFRSNKRKQEIFAEAFQVDLRTATRKAAFMNLMGAILLAPIYIAGILIAFYPSFKSSWNWEYWYLNLFISGVMYIGALIITPNLKKAKHAYLLRSIFLPFQALFFIILGQAVAFVVLPKNYLPWYFLFFLPDLIYAPILFRKKVHFLKTQIQSSTVKWKLKKNPVWDSQEYLPAEMDNTLFNRIGCFYSLFVILAAYFLLNIYSIFSVPVGDLIRFGIVNAFMILIFVEIAYRYIVIYYLLSELEYEIFQPILLKPAEEEMAT